MIKVYASLIIKGIKTIDQVPKEVKGEPIRELVRQELIGRGYSDLAK